MKIGIITLAGGENYGCQLQNYAVTKAYENLGYEAVTVPDSTKRGIRVTNHRITAKQKLKPSYISSAVKANLRNKFYVKNQRDRIIPSIIRRKKCATKYAAAKRERTAVFKDFFDNQIGHTDFSIDIDCIPTEKLSEFDFFSTGSDQVFNPTYPNTSGIKFLSFTDKNKKLSFAPSFGISELPEYTKEHYAKWLSDFNMISVREQRGEEIIRELTGKEAEVICDPTLTISRAQWEEIEKKPSFKTEKPYALTYFLGNEKNNYRRYINKVSKEKGLQVINLFDIRETEYYSAGPAEFIYLVHHADAVFTDSFHAAVFSIIFEKDFVVFDRIEEGRSMGSRLKTLLDTFSLSDRMFSSMKQHSFTSADFSNTKEIINVQKEKALGFLRKNIETNLNS